MKSERVCFFVSDLHGKLSRYQALFAAIRNENPRAVFVGGDVLPGSAGSGLVSHGRFIEEFMIAGFCGVWRDLQDRHDGQATACFLIPGNDDPRECETDLLAGERAGAWTCVHNKTAEFDGYRVFGYPFIPPTPFALKDWERYDVSRFVDPGCVSPEDGYRTTEQRPDDVRYRTIARDLEAFGDSLESAIVLFHAPPYQTPLDRADLEGVIVDYVPVDVHVGSIAVKRFIEKQQPLLTLHGHVHESARLTGTWQHTIGRTVCFSAAHDGEELALIRFDPQDLDSATRELL